MTSADEERNSCPICAYEFSITNRRPRLLSCRHTLCTPCIQHLIQGAPKTRDRMIKCPICREPNVLKDGEEESFMENYFISAENNSSACDLCEKQTNILTECYKCKSSLCDKCFAEHNGSHSKKGTEDSDDEEEGEADDRDSRVLRWARRRYNKIVSTIFVAKPDLSIQCEGSRSVRKILPDDRGGCFVLTNNPMILNYDNSGENTRRVVHRDINIVDICYVANDSMTMVDSTGKVYQWNIKSNTKTKLMTLPEDTTPTALFVKASKYLLIAVRCLKPTYHGSLLKFDLVDNKYLQTDQVTEKEMELRHVTSIDVHSKTSTQYLCDFEQECIVVNAGYRIQRYRGKLSIPRIDHTDFNLCVGERGCRFRPRTLCCDNLRHALIYDDGTKTIHVIDENAVLVGIVFADTLTPMGDPNCLSVDEHGYLWVGDLSTGTVKRYDFNKYLNIYETGDDDEMNQTLGALRHMMNMLPDGLAVQRNPDGTIRSIGVERTVLGGSIRSMSGSEMSSMHQAFEEWMRQRHDPSQSSNFLELSNSDMDPDDVRRLVESGVLTPMGSEMRMLRSNNSRYNNFM